MFTEINPYLLCLECVRAESDPQQHGSEKLDYRKRRKFFASYMAYYKDTKYNKIIHKNSDTLYTRVGTLIVATIYLQLIQNSYTFRSFTVLQCSHQHCVQPVASDVEVVGYL